MGAGTGESVGPKEGIRASEGEEPHKRGRGRARRKERDKERQCRRGRGKVCKRE